MKQVIISDELYDWLTVKFADEVKLPDDSNVEVLNQNTRIEKFWCWAVYGHIYRDGVCLRCGKKQNGTYIDIGKELLNDRDTHFAANYYSNLTERVT